jgi:hypothetical protein
MMVSANSFAGAIPTTKELTIGLSEVFVPGGFSPNTDSYVVVSGMFPNSCYRWSRADVTNTTPLNHEIRAIANVAQNTMCLMVMIPFQKEVELGHLQSGVHTIRFINGDGTYFEKTLTVE